jgi:hypothetical protein
VVGTAVRLCHSMSACRDPPPLGPGWNASPSCCVCSLAAQGPPYKCALRVLAKRYLHRVIQSGCHDPVEDARAAMDLALLKIRNGPGFGTGGDGAALGEPLMEVLAEAGQPASLVDRRDVLNRHVSGEQMRLRHVSGGRDVPRASMFVDA